MKVSELSFREFLKAFSVQELPVTLTEESISDFERLNDPLPIELIHQFIEPEPNEPDGFTEYVACFKLGDTNDFHAVIYWKGELMRYQYFLTTYDKNGRQIANAVIGGLQSDGDILVRSVATIDDSRTIHIIEGEQPASETQYVSQQSKAYQMQITEKGEIIFLDDKVA